MMKNHQQTGNELRANESGDLVYLSQSKGENRINWFWNEIMNGNNWF